MGVPLPPKKSVMEELLRGSSVFIHLDPRKTEVKVPMWFTKQHQLVLQVGLNMAVSIPDLLVDDTGVSCTLSFNRAPFYCRMPWTAIYALVGEDGRGMVWPEDVPREVLTNGTGQSSPSTARGGHLRAVPDEGEEDVSMRESEGSLPGETISSTSPPKKSSRPAKISIAPPPEDLGDDREIETDFIPSAEAKKSFVPKTEKASNRSGSIESAPPAARPAKLEEDLSASSKEPAPETEPTSPLPDGPRPSTPPGSKRSIPPYLRVVK